MRAASAIAPNDDEWYIRRPLFRRRGSDQTYEHLAGLPNQRKRTVEQFGAGQYGFRKMSFPLLVVAERNV